MQVYIYYLFLFTLLFGVAILSKFFKSKAQLLACQIIFILCSIATLVTVWGITEPEIKYIFTDFTQAYYLAGKRILQEPFNLYGDGPGRGFVNLPIVAYLFFPFSFFTRETGAYILTILGLISTGATIYFAMRLLKISTTWQILLVLGLFVANGPLYNSIRMGNTTHFLLPMLFGTILCLRSRRPILAGILVACMGIMKLPLLLLGVYFALKRNWSAFLSFLATIVGVSGASLLVLGWDLHVTWYQKHIYSGGLPIGGYNSQSVNGFLIRLMQDVNLRNWDFIPVDWRFKALRFILLSAFVGITFWVCWKTRKVNTPTTEALEFSSFLCLALLISPITWTHYYLLLLFPFCLYFDQVREGIQYNKIWVALIGISILFVSLPVVSQLPRQPILKVLMSRIAISHYFIGGVLLLGLLLVERWKLSRKPLALPH